VLVVGQIKHTLSGGISEHRFKERPKAKSNWDVNVLNKILKQCLKWDKMQLLKWDMIQYLKWDIQCP